jgi:hypothetical protein
MTIESKGQIVFSALIEAISTAQRIQIARPDPIHPASPLGTQKSIRTVVSVIYGIIFGLYDQVRITRPNY